MNFHYVHDNDNTCCVPVIWHSRCFANVSKLLLLNQVRTTITDTFRQVNGISVTTRKINAVSCLLVVVSVLRIDFVSSTVCRTKKIL
jgi:hypothetical protein